MSWITLGSIAGQPPDTGGYALSAYVILCGILAVYSLSLWIRIRKAGGSEP